ncbi:sigma-54-dependent transcriptional regulator [Thioalkalivibrio sulfidiphilus]|uniref:Two component, sigma54 specific, transcriptional regulator, Fis family n=1 Tax=Thioalkalivibrio sulfidiphilus (strain HL-EbGR7) TaxID=396588 RepID=B8GMA6_THISH|nr:sigma-54 dependent transcriptional regulator [Thioalkalivibrio sulfidiphilus]ACL73693.1 two component, sigma54 specific, transcriptional regulator, Fis family [Thioalkalivibrio sulfidiphilus HL-EbGr7]
MSIQHVLIVDDEPDIRELLEITLGRMKLSTHAAGSVTEARALLSRHDFDLCLTDMRLPDGNGIELVEHIQRHCPCLPVAVITAYGSMDTAVAALKAGAFDFVSKPVDLSMLRDLINTALRLSEKDKARESSEDHDDGSQLLGQAPAMRKLKETIAKLARSQAPVCILGESGSGKERVAREIHRLGPRAERPFVPVNCGAIPTELMESEFFGHVKGAFTGATGDHPGLFQSAQGGTLFLDEVAELPLHMQVKLLRAIQERAVKPVGGSREIPVDVRILSATHRDLAALVREGQFRQDLYYRLNVIELRVPPLRERLEDLPLLSRRILARIAQDWGTQPPQLSEDALAALRAYPFPGNVRELENILERAATLCEGDILEAADLHLPEAGAPLGITARTGADGLPLDDVLEDQERQAILAALAKTSGNRTAAARLLGISFRQLRYRLKKLDIDVPG